MRRLWLATIQWVKLSYRVLFVVAPPSLSLVNRGEEMNYTFHRILKCVSTQTHLLVLIYTTSTSQVEGKSVTQ